MRKYPTIFADAPFRETLSDFHSVKSADFVLKRSFDQYLSLSLLICTITKVCHKI